jgi:hypothetical protein
MKRIAESKGLIAGDMRARNLPSKVIAFTGYEYHAQTKRKRKKRQVRLFVLQFLFLVGVFFLVLTF